MTTTAQSIVADAQTALQDPTGTRWPASELVGYLNDGQREIVTVRPDITAGQVTFVPAAGSEQDIPSTAMVLLDVLRNTSGKKRAITKVRAALLDATARDWRSMTGVTEFTHFCHDLSAPRSFDLYPPAAATGASIELLVAAYPTDVAAPTSPGKLASTVSGSISLTDEWANALRKYVIFRALSKDAEYGGNSALAANHYQLFKAALGEQLQSSAAVAPKE